MRQLQSYLQGQWNTGEGDGRQLFDATSGKPIATASTKGLDLGAALQWSRSVGGKTLRSMTFAERAAVLKGMSVAIHEARDDLIALARENSGNTRGDAKFDIDGAAGTLSYYAYIGKSLGDQTFLFDGPAENILRSARFVGQHISVSRRGVAIHINAFNFPAWGMFEKLAVSLLAGVPVLEKPGTATATVSEAIVKLWHDKGLIPDGAVSLLCGSVGDLLDHVQHQDCIAFTGSGTVGAKVRGHQRVVAMNVPVNIEADSLNASVLAPDVDAGSDTFVMFINEVSRDLTQKAGQKCTAVRRILVPAQLEEAVVEMLTERLDDAAVGDPADRGTRVGPLATASQQRDVLAGLAELNKTATRVYGSQEDVPDAGYFVRPQLFRTDQGVSAAYVHEHEVFGPCATILTYSGDADEAVDIVSKGGGGLVCSFYSNNRDWARTLLLGLAPWHGRLYWGSKKVHDQGSGPGTVLPGQTHGGPGKAGGGEELGGLRGLSFYMQRTAIQADRGMLDKVLGKNSQNG